MARPPLPAARRLRSRDVRPVEGVDAGLSEAGDTRREVLVGWLADAGEGPLLLAHERGPVDCVIDRLAQVDVREERAARVQSEEGGAQDRPGEVALSPGSGRLAARAIASREPRNASRRNPVRSVVGLARLDLSDRPCFRDAERVDDLVDLMGASPGNSGYASGRSAHSACTRT